MAKITEKDVDVYAFPEQGNFLKLDLACGDRRQEGFAGVDVIGELPGVDYICNLEVYPWQMKKVHRHHATGIQHGPLELLPDKSVGEIYISHFLEHVSDVAAFANEIYRVLIPHGRVRILAPYFSGIQAVQDTTHKHGICEHTFAYWNAAWRKQERLEHYPYRCDFNPVFRKFYYHEDFETRGEAAKEYARKHLVNSVLQIEVQLEAIK